MSQSYPSHLKSFWRQNGDRENWTVACNLGEALIVEVMVGVWWVGRWRSDGQVEGEGGFAGWYLKWRGGFVVRGSGV